MDETPKILEEFDNKKELELYISKLHDYVELLEEELEESKKDNRKLKQELNELAENVSENKTEIWMKYTLSWRSLWVR